MSYRSELKIGPTVLGGRDLLFILGPCVIETPEFSWEIEGIDYVGHSDGKDVVVVRGHEQRSYADGRVFDEHLAEFFAWKGGRIVEVTQYSRKP